MAITGGDRLIWRELRSRGLIPEAPAVLEIGRANWYGDVPLRKAAEDYTEFGDRAPAPTLPPDPWSVADWWYGFMLRSPSRRVAIDLDPQAALAGGVTVLQHDLNEPISAASRFDIIINTGTCEHVFDQRCVWESIHDACKSDGLMVHSLPLWGWLDHGFVNYQPTLIADLAAENDYEVLHWIIHEIKTGWSAEIRRPENVRQFANRAAQHSAMMHVAFAKRSGEPFRVPMQGVYSNRKTHQQQEAWLAHR